MAESVHSTRAEVSSQAISAASLAKSAKGGRRADMEAEFLRLFDSLSLESKHRFVKLVEWEAYDRRPATDPRNGDPWWEEFEQRRRALRG